MLMRGVLIAVLLAAMSAWAVEDRFPRVADAYIVKRDGRVLWAAGEHERHAPASLTKMMTALLVLERSELDEPVVVSRAAARERGSRPGGGRRGAGGAGGGKPSRRPRARQPHRPARRRATACTRAPGRNHHAFGQRRLPCAGRPRRAYLRRPHEPARGDARFEKHEL